MAKTSEKDWAELRKACTEKVQVGLGQAFHCRKTAVVGSGLLGAVLGVAASEGAWWVFAPGSRGSAGHIVSDVAGGVVGAGGGTVAGLYVARSEVRREVGMNAYMGLRAFAELKEMDPEDVVEYLNKKDIRQEFIVELGEDVVEALMRMAEKDPKQFKEFTDKVAKALTAPTPPSGGGSGQPSPNPPT